VEKTAWKMTIKELNDILDPKPRHIFEADKTRSEIESADPIERISETIESSSTILTDRWE
jgi:hypothetical protein